MHIYLQGILYVLLYAMQEAFICDKAACKHKWHSPQLKLSYSCLVS